MNEQPETIIARPYSNRRQAILWDIPAGYRVLLLDRADLVKTERFASEKAAQQFANAWLNGDWRWQDRRKKKAS